MDPAVKKYLFGYAVVVILLAASFLFMRRGSKRPVQLRLKEGPPTSPFEIGKVASAPPLKKAVASAPPPPSREDVIALNPLFNWNGHTWDAYEVLGLPAGSSIQSVHNAYAKIAANADDDSKLFFKAAYDAITSLR